MILKNEIKNKYSRIPNSIIQDKTLTDGAYRLLMYLYSLPDGWEINQDWLGKELGCNRININKKIRQIKEKGYLLIHKSRTDEADYIYELVEPNVSLNDVSVSDVSLGNVLVNDTHINTYISNTELTNNNSNNKKNISKDILKKSFQKPTLEEVTNYCLERNNKVEPERFIDYYESNGWMVGKTKMKDWKASVRLWERNNFNNNTPTKIYNDGSTSTEGRRVF